jgi:hypothetical protein
MSDMEPEMQRFLKRIMLCIVATITWFFINMTAGLFSGWMFFRGSPGAGNYVFYAWFLVSLILLIYILIRLLKKPVS